MSSPEDAIKLAEELKDRQATLATRGFGRKQRPSLHGSSLGSHASSSSLGQAGPSSPPPTHQQQHGILLEDDENDQQELDAAEHQEHPITLPDDDDEDAGNLEMDYAPATTTVDDAREQVDDDDEDNEQEGRSLAAEILAASPPRRKKRRPSSLRRTDSNSSAGRQSITSIDSLPERTRRASIPRSESATTRDSAAIKRMTVLLEGEMPEGGPDVEPPKGDEIGQSESDAEAASQPAVSKRGTDRDVEELEAAAKATRMSEHADAQVEAESDAEGTETGSEAEEQSEEDEEDSDEGDDEEEEDVEPSLKYSRVKGSATDVFKRDTASAFTVSSRFMALGTHGGMIYILDIDGNLVKGFRLHTASILDLVIDSTSDFVAAASMDGLVSISALATAEQYIFDFKRPMRCISLEPNFGRKSSRSFVCGGMAGSLSHREKSWFGHKETVLHSGEGPIWTTRWRGNFIAWASDKGVRIYDTSAHQRISFISPPSANVRADLYRCTLYWQDDRTLLVAWADHIKIAKIRERNPANVASSASSATSSLAKVGGIGSAVGVGGAGSSGQTQYVVEITAIFQLDCMISGIAPYGLDLLVLAYVAEDVYNPDSEGDSSFEVQRRREALRPELRIISRAGEELSSDVLSLNDYARFQCNDYLLVPSAEARAYSAAMLAGRKVRSDATEACQFYVVSPKDIVVSKPRDEKDHVEWLLERQRFQEALVKVEAMGRTAALENGFDAEEIGKKYLNYLVESDRYADAAKVASKILGRNVGAWEDWIFLFVEKGKLATAIPYIPTSDPTLSGLVYDMILAHFLQHDPQKLLQTVQEWPPEIYSTQAVVLAIEDQLADGTDLKQMKQINGAKADQHKVLLMECLAEIFIRNRQPSKALVWFLRLRKANVFDLIRENNLFTAVQDQALLLIEFEEDLKSRRGQVGDGEAGVDGDKKKQQQEQHTRAIAGGGISKHGAAIDLLVDHTFSIPIGRVIQQLEGHPRYLYMYLDALFERDTAQVTPFCDLQVKLYAEYEPSRLMAYLRAMSSFYSFEKAYEVCSEHDYIPEMVFLLGRVGDNKRALSLIIERLGDVERAIDFAKEQNDDDLWEDLLKYSESRPAFIRGLLENVGPEIDPIRLIRRIKDGLHIPGLKPALIKILSDFSLQISLLEGCEAILSHDVQVAAQELQRSQRYATFADTDSVCSTCNLALFSSPGLAGAGAAGSESNSNSKGAQKTVSATDTFEAARRTKTVVFLCGHLHHLTCLIPPANLPAPKPEPTRSLASLSTTSQAFSASSSVRLRWNQFDSLSDAAASRYASTSTLKATANAAATYGPKARADSQSDLFIHRLAYDARLRPVLSRKGCPTCKKQGLLSH
ncbi:hypothetical protein BCV70DRAFT_197537 [Testicularia cyperi]|uniref:Vps41 beta-propeller domain-containing protein n=1 Tax=Testicularia cyperi TaxID=1882483 RepID=A0A317XYE1_9BASI|nr:hypothetical protein BCV70DRAFT_197537 [Testicularia cyperi]